MVSRKQDAAAHPTQPTAHATVGPVTLGARRRAAPHAFAVHSWFRLQPIGYCRPHGGVSAAVRGAALCSAVHGCTVDRLIAHHAAHHRRAVREPPQHKRIRCAERLRRSEDRRDLRRGLSKGPQGWIDRFLAKDGTDRNGYSGAKRAARETCAWMQHTAYSSRAPAAAAA